VNSDASSSPAKGNIGLMHCLPCSKQHGFRNKIVATGNASGSFSPFSNNFASLI